MRVGLMATFQNMEREHGDRAVYEHELALALSAEKLGFDAVWTVEHHFNGYQMNTDTLRFLSFVAGATKTIELGAGCVVLPWHDPVRVIEDAIAVDHYSGGRLILGIARGAGREEFEGFKVDMNQTRPIFVEYAEMILEALETGVAQYDGEHLKQPRVEIRPDPYKSFKGRTYCGAVSPESMDIMAKLGVGMLITPNKPWDVVAQEMMVYREAFERYHGAEPVPTQFTGWVFVDEDEDRARDEGRKWIKRYWGTVLEHYGFNKPEKFKGVKGYEHYEKGAEQMAQAKAEALADGFCDFHFYGTPEQVVRKIADVQKKVGGRAFNGVFSYAGMPFEEADRNLDLFVRKVMPELKKIPEPTRFGSVVENDESVSPVTAAWS